MVRDRPVSVLHPLSPHLVFFAVLGGFAIDAGIAENWLGEDWAFSGALMTLTGILGITYTAWCWRGRTVQARSWAHIRWGADQALIAVPFFSLACLGIGMRAFLGLPKLIAGIPLLGCAWLVIVLIAAFFSKDDQHDCPKWWGPRWFRNREYKDADERPWDPLGTMMGGGTSTASNPIELDVVVSADQIRHFAADAEPVESWSGGWVHDPDIEEQDHSAARKGTVEGTISWYPHGLAFTASHREDTIRRRPTVLTIPVDQITEATVVPARAGADGQQRANITHRSPFPRLVVHTTGESYVFDIDRNNAKHAADFLNQQVNQPS